jgi:hypothetical protein
MDVGDVRTGRAERYRNEQRTQGEDPTDSTRQRSELLASAPTAHSVPSAGATLHRRTARVNARIPGNLVHFPGSGRASP